jgi:hypothetical protein
MCFARIGTPAGWRYSNGNNRRSRSRNRRVGTNKLWQHKPFLQENEAFRQEKAAIRSPWELEFAGLVQAVPE